MRGPFVGLIAVGMLLVPGGPVCGAEQAPEVATSLWSRQTGDDWPGFLGPNRDGKSAETGIRTDWSAGLPILWQREVGEGYSAPAVVAGRLFMFDRHGDTARLTAFHAETGEELWRQEYPTHYKDYYDYSNGPRASPVVDGDRVYTLGVEGLLRCHRMATGKLLWVVDTVARYGVVQSFFGVAATPAVEGGLLIVQVGGSPTGSPKIHSGGVEPNTQQVERLLVTAIEACDRYFQAFQFVVWAGKSANEALEGALFETVGEA